MRSSGIFLSGVGGVRQGGVTPLSEIALNQKEAMEPIERDPFHIRGGVF